MNEPLWLKDFDEDGTFFYDLSNGFDIMLLFAKGFGYTVSKGLSACWDFYSNGFSTLFVFFFCIGGFEWIELFYPLFETSWLEEKGLLLLDLLSAASS